MIAVGDRIQFDKPFGRKVTVVILEINYRNGTYIAKVRREDYNQEDVFVWNSFQNGISVHKLEGEKS